MSRSAALIFMVAAALFAGCSPQTPIAGRGALMSVAPAGESTRKPGVGRGPAPKNRAPKNRVPKKQGLTVTVDANLPDYEAVEGVSGTIKSIGSDSMNNLMTFWTQGFQEFYPNVQVEVEGKGSATAPPALIAGAANFGPMSREMQKKEEDAFESAFGYPPVALPTSIDMLAVYVHKDNPIAEKGLSLEQLDAIFSKNRRGGCPNDITTWGQLALTGKWAEQPISLYGRNSASGTNGYFKEYALFEGDYKDSVKQLPGSASVVQAIATNRNAIGYSGIGYLTADVRAVPLESEGDGEFVSASAENGMSGDYPLSRYLYLYVNYSPGDELDPLRREFIRFVFSRQGQRQVIKDGYLPIDHETAAEALASVGLPAK